MGVTSYAVPVGKQLLIDSGWGGMKCGGDLVRRDRHVHLLS